MLIPATALVIVTSLQFVEVGKHRVVIEVNVPGRTAYQTVLGNAENLARAFKPDPVQIEIVCEGPGIQMLLKTGNPFAHRLEKLQSSTVHFCACSNTLRGMGLKKERLLPFVRVVDSGVAEVVRKQEDGWSYLKGAY